MGFLISKIQPKEKIEIVRKPTESEIIAYLEKQESEYIAEWDEVAQVALEGDVDASLKMFNLCTYADRDYERSYFWAMLSERQGVDTKFGSLIEVAEGNIEAKYWSRTRDPDRGKVHDPEDASGLLPILAE